MHDQIFPYALLFVRSHFLFLLQFLLHLFINGRLVISVELWFLDTMAMAFFFQLLPDHPGVLIAAAQVNDGLLVAASHINSIGAALCCSHFFFLFNHCLLRPGDEYSLCCCVAVMTKRLFG